MGGERFFLYLGVNLGRFLKGHLTTRESKDTLVHTGPVSCYALKNITLNDL